MEEIISQRLICLVCGEEFNADVNCPVCDTAFNMEQLEKKWVSMVDGCVIYEDRFVVIFPCCNHKFHLDFLCPKCDYQRSLLDETTEQSIDALDEDHAFSIVFPSVSVWVGQDIEESDELDLIDHAIEEEEAYSIYSVCQEEEDEDPDESTEEDDLLTEFDDEPPYGYSSKNDFYTYSTEDENEWVLEALEGFEEFDEDDTDYGDSSEYDEYDDYDDYEDEDDYYDDKDEY